MTDSANLAKKEGAFVSPGEREKKERKSCGGEKRLPLRCFWKKKRRPGLLRAAKIGGKGRKEEVRRKRRRHNRKQPERESWSANSPPPQRRGRWRGRESSEKSWKKERSSILPNNPE